MANDHTPDPNPNNEPSRSPLMFIIMAVIIVLGILAFFLLRSGGTGGGTQSSPAKGHTSLQPAAPATSNFKGPVYSRLDVLTSQGRRIAS